MAVMITNLIIDGAFPYTQHREIADVVIKMVFTGLVAGTLAYVFFCAVINPKLREMADKKLR